MNLSHSSKSADRLVSILQCFSLTQLELSAAEISRKVGMPKSTAHRLLKSLTESRILEKNAKTLRYTIGPELYFLGSLYLDTTDVIKEAWPVAKTLSNLTRENTYVGILDKSNILYLLKEKAQRTVSLDVLGMIAPAYTSSMGKALLSELPDEEIDKLYPEERLRPLTAKTIPTRTALKLVLEQIRKTGVSFDRGGSTEYGDGIGIVIRDASGKAVAAMSISVPIFRMNEARRNKLATLLKFGACLVSYRLGYRDNDCHVHDIEEICSWWREHQMNSDSQANALPQAVLINHDRVIEE